jgi:hypothetical protein
MIFELIWWRLIGIALMTLLVGYGLYAPAVTIYLVFIQNWDT